MSTAYTKHLRARIAAAAWFAVPAMWSISAVLDRSREWEGPPQMFWLAGWAALLLAGVIQLITVIETVRPARTGPARAGTAVLGLGLAVTVIAGWWVPLWLALYAAGMLLAGWATSSRVTSFIGVSFTVGAGVFILLTLLEVGRPDRYGDYPIAWVTAYFVGALGAGLGMLLWPGSEEERVEARTESEAAV